MSDPCAYSACRSVFKRVVVNHITRGGTRVAWLLTEDFEDPLPYRYQLQVGRTGNLDATDWENVGLPMADSFYAVDDEQRVWGKTNWSHYRVQLTTSRGIYYSNPEPGLGALSRRDWRLSREILRKEMLLGRYARQNGFLLKRKFYGERCPVCTDYQTNEVRDPYDSTCLGTGYVGGYFTPLPCVWADLDLEAAHTTVDGQRGTVKDVVVGARMFGAPQLHEDDVWVDQNDDRRYYVHSITNVAEMRGVPLIVRAELRPAAFNDSIYEIDIPDHLPEIAL